MSGNAENAGKRLADALPHALLQLGALKMTDMK